MVLTTEKRNSFVKNVFLQDVLSIFNFTEKYDYTVHEPVDLSRVCREEAGNQVGKACFALQLKTGG